MCVCVTGGLCLLQAAEDSKMLKAVVIPLEEVV